MARFGSFLRVRKRYWLLPMLLALCVIGGLIALPDGGLFFLID